MEGKMEGQMEGWIHGWMEGRMGEWKRGREEGKKGNSVSVWDKLIWFSNVRVKACSSRAQRRQQRKQ